MREIRSPLSKKLNDATLRFQEMAMAVQTLDILDKRVLAGDREGENILINGAMFRDSIIGFVEGAKSFPQVKNLLDKEAADTWRMLQEIRTSFAAHRFGKLRYCVSAAYLFEGDYGPAYSHIVTLQSNWACPARPHIFSNYMRPYVAIAEQAVKELGQELAYALQAVEIEDLLKLPLAEIPAVSPYDELMSGKERRRQKATSKG